MDSKQSEPLLLTLDPRMDQAVSQSANAWESAARAAGVNRTTAWLARRQEDPGEEEELAAVVVQLLDAQEPGDVVQARAELAELVEGHDDALAELLWESIREYAIECADGEMLANATVQLATIAENQGDFLAAAEYHLAFLNWRRQGSHASDPDDVQMSFDEVIRLAELDHEPGAGALYSFRQASFTRLAEAEDERAIEGDWESSTGPYTGWA